MQATTDLAERISLISESSTMKVAADADRLRREGKDVVDFGAGEPDFPTPENIKQAAIAAIDANFTKYTPTGGILELKNAICDRHRTDYGTNYSPAECMVTVGGKHAIFNLMQAVIGEGDEVIIPVPYWVTYKDVVNYAGGKCVFVPTDEANGFTFTADMIAPYITSRSKLLIINSPNNPSGAVLSREEFEKIYWLASKRGVRLMTDECYCRFLYEGEPFSIASMPGRQGTRRSSGFAFEDLCHDRLAHRLRARAQASDRRHDEAAEPHHVESYVGLAEGGDRSLARPAGFHRRDARGVPETARLRCQPACALFLASGLPSPKAHSMLIPTSRSDFAMESRRRCSSQKSCWPKSM